MIASDTKYQIPGHDMCVIPFSPVYSEYVFIQGYIFSPPDSILIRRVFQRLENDKIE